jgi:dTDP-4-dehydrorhamnose reductase
MSQHILLFGRDGQVGWELCCTLMPLGTVQALTEQDVDLTDHTSVQRIIQEQKPDIIINAAAYTAVDKAETDVDVAMAVNGVAPGVMAESARQCGALLVHYSTDYVFDGTKHGAYTETDVPNPLNIYGKSKLAGDDAVMQSGTKHWVLRTSWVYSTRGQNFLLTMLRLMREREQLGIVSDQQGAPTWARLIAETTALMIGRYVGKTDVNWGMYNLAASGVTSWYGFADKIREYASQRETLTLDTLSPIATADYPTPAARPLNSQLDMSKIEQDFGLTLPAWDVALERCMDI